VGGSLRSKKKCIKLNHFEFPEEWGVLRKNPFHGGGMDIFWNCTIRAYREYKLCNT